ncbi:MAG: hypothetical protein ABGX43_07185 [Nitrospinaceae bacterium]|nr:hypothetical protein [Nitrospinaceae bacterium]HIK58885.1 hypothetical protein [Nitrospinaceae bacterium]
MLDDFWIRISAVFILVQIASNLGEDFAPAMSLDGKQLVFVACDDDLKVCDLNNAATFLLIG